MTHKEYLNHRLLLQTLDWLIKKVYGNMLGEDKEKCILTAVETTLHNLQDKKYWKDHRFIAIPNIANDNLEYLAIYFVFAI